MIVFRKEDTHSDTDSIDMIKQPQITYTAAWYYTAASHTER